MGMNKINLIAGRDDVLAMNRLPFSAAVQGNEKENGPWFNVDEYCGSRKRESFNAVFKSWRPH